MPQAPVEAVGFEAEQPGAEPPEAEPSSSRPGTRSGDHPRENTMSVVLTLLGLVAFVVLTAGTALFVAAEFSLTALERSTVDANARRGDRRDIYVQRAHRHVVVSAVRGAGRNLDHHVDHRLSG